MRTKMKKFRTRRTPDDLQNALKFTRWNWVVSVPKWTEDDVQMVREGLINETLHEIVDGRLGSGSVKENWDWIMSDSEHPFSFRVCARDAGCDPDELRGGFVSFVKKLQKSAAQRAGENVSGSQDSVGAKEEDFTLIDLTAESGESEDEDKGIEVVGSDEEFGPDDVLNEAASLEDIPEELLARA